MWRLREQAILAYGSCHVAGDGSLACSSVGRVKSIAIREKRFADRVTTLFSKRTGNSSFTEANWIRNRRGAILILPIVLKLSRIVDGLS